MNKLFVLLLLVFVSCARAPMRSSKELMRKTNNVKEITDSLSRESFFQTLTHHLEVIKKSPMVKDPMDFGVMQIAKKDYISELEKLLSIKDDQSINHIDYIKENFQWFEVYGNTSWSEVMVTGYYEPWVKGSKTRTHPYSRALYKVPSDLVSVDTRAFYHRLKSLENFPTLQGRMEKNQFVPYYSREEIEAKDIFKGKKLEIVYVDPIDAFFIQIQGSGVVELANGEIIRVGYAGQNGHLYQSIGKFLTNYIPKEEMSMQRIKEYLHSVDAKERERILNLNPSYVFFDILPEASLTLTGTHVSPGRTIATDQFLFPKGALAYLDVDYPIFDEAHHIKPVRLESKARFVFDQDTGGAIRGPARVDLYIGHGEEAAQIAGGMKNPGKLYYLVPTNLLH